MKREWKIKKLSEKFINKSVIEKLLSLRGIEKKEDAKEFLNPYEVKISNPNAFKDMERAVERISKAIENNEKIVVYGDFDADGVTSTSVLLKTFEELNANVSYFIPNRETEGHGLNSKSLVKIMTKEKPKLIITVDCGISNVEEVNFINSFKIDVIITDHHEAPEILPKAIAIINPKSPNALDENLSAKEILSLTSHAGVGVAFKLSQALLMHYDKISFINELLPFVAVGTIADLVPLVGENRYYVTKGLELISKGKHYGIKRLLENAGYDLSKNITSEQVAFGIAPRINASGRLDTVDDALKVMISKNKQEIEMSIISLEQLNKVRQELCENTFLEADEMLKKEGNKHDAIILFNPKWHVGIIGIVASKFVEKYYKPTFLMTYSEETKQIKCSARGIEEVNIYDVLDANSEYFDGFGGHAMAGGLSFNSETTSFESVKKAINKTVSEILNGQKLSPALKIDLELEPNDINENLMSDIERMQPFGAENPNPIFAMYNLTLRQKKLIGSKKNHLKLLVEDSQNNTYDCLWWSKGDISLDNGDLLDLAFYPQLNDFNGNVSIQFIVQDIHADKLVYEEEQDETQANFKIYDHRKKTGIFANVEDYVKTSNLKIGVFAEDKDIIENLKLYKAISERIIKRNNENHFDSIMFFDYPPSQEIFENIIEKCSPKAIHFMNYEPKIFDEKDYLKTLYGMLKFSSNSRNGKFEIKRAASFLALTEEVVENSLELFEKSKIINIKNKTPEIYETEFLDNDISNVLHTQEYNLLLNDIKMIRDYKESFADADLSNFINF